MAPARRLGRLRCDAAFVVSSNHGLAAAVLLARIPVRIGPGQRGYSFLYNRPVLQDQPPIHHETAYCLDLLRPLDAWRRLSVPRRAGTGRRDLSRRRVGDVSSEACRRRALEYFTSAVCACKYLHYDQRAIDGLPLEDETRFP